MSNDKLYLIGKSGSVLNSKDLDTPLVRSSLGENKDVIKLFNFYNTNKDDKLDEDELNKMLTDLLSAAGDDAILNPQEIKAKLSQMQIDKSVGIDDFIAFINSNIVNKDTDTLFDNIDGVWNSSSLDDNLENINPENITKILENYKSKNKITLIQHIANESGSWGSTRNNYLKIVRDKLVECANLSGVNKNDITAFKTIFNNELDRMDITWGQEEDATKLDAIVSEFLKQLKPREKILQANKNGILMMMADPELSYKDKDGERLKEKDAQAIMDKIFEYSNKYNPKEMLTNIIKTTKDETLKQVAKKLIESNFLDYYPIFVASIIAQESQFRETDDDIFTKNGQGVMQITEVLLDDMYQNSSFFDDNFINKITSEYENANDLYTALTEDRDVELNYEIGTVGLKGKLNTVLKRIKNGTYKERGINTSYPEVILQLVAMEYNSNSQDKKKDPDYKNKPVELRYVYSKNVIKRFKKYTPQGVSVKHFFDYNPNKGRIENK